MKYIMDINNGTYEYLWDLYPQYVNLCSKNSFETLTIDKFIVEVEALGYISIRDSDNSRVFKKK